MPSARIAVCEQDGSNYFVAVTVYQSGDVELTVVDRRKGPPSQQEPRPPTCVIPLALLNSACRAAQNIYDEGNVVPGEPPL